MADADDVRRIALALPAVQEIDSDGFDFRVGGRGFVWSYPERRPGKPRVIRTDIAVLFVGDEAEKQALLLGEPGVFFTAPGYDGWPLVMLRLAEVDAERLRELVTDAGGCAPPTRSPASLTSPARTGRSRPAEPGSLPPPPAGPRACAPSSPGRVPSALPIPRLIRSGSTNRSSISIASPVASQLAKPAMAPSATAILDSLEAWLADRPAP